MIVLMSYGLRRLLQSHTAPAVPPTRKLVHALLGLRLEAAGLQSAFHATLWTVPMATCKEVNVSGFEEFDQAVKEHKGKTIFAYFSGSKDAEGKSWCPDCVEAEPVVREGLKSVTEDCVFIYCQVGDKSYWKDPNNDFRQQLQVTAVPTLLKYGTPQKLVESECSQANLVEMIFSED
ncbi:thioredoxin domain-containing protein 17 isoform X1 [Cricetulus griseus]|uniref:Thioredoxin domain-containing protein 17 n=2 Tax=Cricetulus griseus TaxID=10029 RepID=G3HSA7_CRIGR|nr:thioredoxin domain-containing protein 17 isoform X1 [Cricetulus griseus]EGW06936.1 Thioredoxin domain-containing protein 17 [Cricetulus griseus]